MTVTFNQSVRAAMLNTYGTATAGPVSLAYTNCVPQMVFFSGTPPTNADTALSSNTVLGYVPFNASTPAFGSPTVAVPSVATANAMQTGTVSVTGTASMFRIYAGQSAATANSNSTIYTANQIVMIAVVGTGSPNWAAMGCGGTPAVGSVFLTNGTTGTGTGSTAYLLGLASGAGMCVAQGTAGAGSGDANMNSVSFVAGGTITISSMTQSM